ncbi:hypothetical protein H8K52_10615 [Undibacterium seohonense]|uniref:Sulfotransferase family protein n=1 Tax=Undibacterium seohonense TaxID=1344950 RepID=A0ABR6X4L7_9BURK|nr:sulfotransferase [Undibacterium seohonense]MBC3807795.1 hypothetical protein [Undibacterium seohonense]
MSQQTGFSSVERSFIRGQSVDVTDLESLKNWYPVLISKHPDEVFWRDMGQQRFTDSFFQNSLDAQDRNLRRVCKTGKASLASIEEYIAPTAFVFHISRCGSTLLTQMLASLEQCIVLSEPPVVDQFFRNYCKGKEINEEQITIFRQLIAVLGQKRFDRESHFIIKFDSWHIDRLDFIRQAYPDVPVLFLYRQPQEVLASHQKQRGPQMIPNFIDLGNIQVDQHDVQISDLDAYCLRVLDQYLLAALQHADNRQLHLINYAELPTVVWEKCLPDLHIKCTEDELQSLRHRASFHSKHPQQNFAEKLEVRAPHPFLAHTQALYAQLEGLRLQQSR